MTSFLFLPVLTLTCYKIMNLTILVNLKWILLDIRTNIKMMWFLKQFSSSILLLIEQNSGVRAG